jgi:hypothetical protein
MLLNNAPSEPTVNEPTVEDRYSGWYRASKAER